jgi:hypothetical protein
MRRVFALVVCALFPIFLFAGKDIDSLLRVLDKTIANSKTYSNARELKLTELRGNDKNATSVQKHFSVSAQLYTEYRSYKYDSAFNNCTVQLPDTQVTTSTCFKSTDGTTISAVDCSTFTGISAVKDKLLTIFPNPVVDKLNFSTSSAIDQVKIYSITGKNVMIVTENVNKGIVDVKSLKPGVYFVSVYFANGKQQFEKIVKR